MGGISCSDSCQIGSEHSLLFSSHDWRSQSGCPLTVKATPTCDSWSWVFLKFVAVLLPTLYVDVTWVAPDRDKSHSRLHFAHLTRTISAEGCSGPGHIALSPAFCALHARSPQKVAPDKTKSHSHLHFAHPTRTISAEGCRRPNQIALLPAFRVLDTHDLRRGLRFVAVRWHCPRP